MELLSFVLPPTSGAERRGVMVNLGLGEELARIVPLLHGQYRHRFMGCRQIVVRPPPMLQRDAILEGERRGYEELVSRFPGVSISLLCSKKL